jgi:uncharacterized protein (DUF1800 family)
MSRWTPRLFLGLLLLTLLGCGGRAVGPGSAIGTVGTRDAPAPAESGAILHLLQRATYGPRPADVAAVQAIGVDNWVERQLDPARIDDTAVDRALGALPTLGLSIADLHREYPRPDAETRRKLASGEMSPREMREQYPMDRRPAWIVAELQAARMLRAVASERQLQEVMVDFWFNHFNVFPAKGEVRWYVTGYERDVIRPHALGRFPDLLRATARHPAMLFYLDNWLSARAGFTPRRGPSAGRPAGLNENYARELMELHTLGVDGGYTQADVTEVARAFTGWTIDRPRQDAQFVFRPTMHDPGAKRVLGKTISAGGQGDGEQVLDLLAVHPATARFIAGKLARRFVADEPPPALVERVATTYRDTGGDVRAMLRVILTSREFRAREAAGAKIKKPAEFVASAARAVGATADTRGALALARAAAEIGEGLYGAAPPTGYPDRAEAWVNPGALLARLNFALALVENRVPGVRVGTDDLAGGVDRREPATVLQRLLTTLLNGRVSEETRAVLTAQLGLPEITRLTGDDRGPANTDVAKLAALVLGSPEFQRR